DKVYFQLVGRRLRIHPVPAPLMDSLRTANPGRKLGLYVRASRREPRPLDRPANGSFHSAIRFSMKQLRAFLLALGAWTLPATPAALAQGDRRERAEPHLMLETGARMGTCDVVAFTPDGNHLLAAGDDKVVR